MAAIVICDNYKIQSHDHISLVHNIAALNDSASVEASVIRYLPKMDPKLLHSKTNETTPRTPTTSSVQCRCQVIIVTFKALL